MFDNLSNRLTKTARNLIGRGRITEDNIKETLKEIRTALLDADVALEVVKEFTDKVATKALGQDVLQSLKPGEMLIKIVNDELTETLGQTTELINLRTQPPAVILMVGLQGAGKTTTCGKLANYLKKELKKSTLLVSTDVYRPAAIEQLELVASQVEAPFFQSTKNDNPVKIAKAAIKEAKVKNYDTVIIDSAGRLHIDDEMMQELVAIKHEVGPIETILVVDSMIGQDAANVAKQFNEQLGITGVILTKADGDARGGAALSMRMLTHVPIKFLGVGEKLTALEVFHPERVASRILGMGDIVGLVEETKSKIDTKKAEKLAKKIRKGKNFDFEDFRDQLKQMRSMGGLSALVGKLPGLALPPAAKNLLDDRITMRMEAIINSMTIQERRFPDIIKGSRKKRIAAGSGTEVQDVNRLLKQFQQMQKMLKRFKGGGMTKMMGMMKNIPGMH